MKAEKNKMNMEFHGNNIVEIIDNSVLIKDVDDALSLFCTMEDCSTIILKKENIIDDFFNLATGIAGEILQKFSNYRMRMAIIGDFEHIQGKALKDFICESNRTKRIVFVKTPDEALKIFRDVE